MSETAYVWTGVLCDWTCGMAVVMAESVEDAYQKVRKNEDMSSHVKEELLTTEPEPIEADEIKWIYGGG